MPQIWLFGDLHFLHPKVAFLRGFSSVEHHDSTIIRNIKRVVRDGDECWHLGDDYLGDKEITVQTEFGLNYVKNFFGYSTLFLLPDAYIEQKKVIAVPVENIDLYYVDPADRDYATMGANYTVSGETNLLGYHTEYNYKNATTTNYAIMGMKLWAEYLDGIAVATVSVADAG